VLGAVFWLGWQNTGAMIALVLSQMVVALGGISLLWRQLARSQRDAIRPTWSTLRTLMGGGLKLHLNAIGAILFTSTDVLIVNQYHGATATGHYQFAVAIISALMVVPQAATLVLYSQMAQSGPVGSWGVQRRVLLVLVGLMALGGALAAALAPWLLPLIAGDAFLPSIPVFQILVIMLIGSTFATTMAPQWIGQGLFWQASLLTLAVGLLNLVTNLLAVPTYGMIGAAWATVASYSIAIITNGWMVIRCEIRYRRQAVLHPNRITP
jgi:O-antigen/teichoic acid export membrane protein